MELYEEAISLRVDMKWIGEFGTLSTDYTLKHIEKDHEYLLKR